MVHEIGDRFPTFENTLYKEMVRRGERNYRLFAQLDRPRRRPRAQAAGALRRLVYLLPFGSSGARSV